MLTYSSLTNLWSDKSIFEMFAVNFSTKYLTEFSQRSVPFRPSSFNPEQLSEMCWIDSKFSCLAQDSCKICKLSLQKALPDYDRAQYIKNRFDKLDIFQLSCLSSESQNYNWTVRIEQRMKLCTYPKIQAIHAQAMSKVENI